MIFYFIVFVLGLVIGSFLNCVIYRLEQEKSFLKGRSYCTHCKHELAWQDLIPIFSFVFLRGKCRYCQKPISFQYPLVEIATGILFVLIYYSFPNILVSCFLSLVSCLLVIIFVYDLKHFIIPDNIIYLAVAIAFLFNILNSYFVTHNSYFIANSLGAAFSAALFFLLIVLVSKGQWMGIGDIKLAFFMGLFLGFPNVLLALFSAFFLGAIIGIGLVISRKRTLKSEIPFGPFLVTGTFLALFWGSRIINWYLNLFL